jgi:hypothetical protein
MLPLQPGPGAVADDLTAVDAPTPRQTHFDDV